MARDHQAYSAARRRFCWAFVGVLTAPAIVGAQPTPMRRVGVLAPSTLKREQITLAPFFAEMRKLGWRDGDNVQYDWSVADDHDDLMPRRAAELVARHPELIYAPPSIAAIAAKNMTTTIPIVFAVATDPVENGLVPNLAHPGGNVTGVASVTTSIAPKRLELLREALPQAKRIGVLFDVNDAASIADQAALAPAAARLGLTIVGVNASTPAEFKSAMQRLVSERVDAIFPTAAVLTRNMSQEMIAASLRARIPVVGHRRYTSIGGGLFSYGASLDDQITRSAQLVDKVLRGTKPGDIPVEQPTRFELVINLHTAKTLGITIPQAVLLRADEVIQ
jgi:putative ABC transport system substrate-binding protein